MGKLRTSFLLLLALQGTVAEAAPPWDWCRRALERLSGQPTPGTQEERVPQTAAAPVSSKTSSEVKASSTIEFASLPGRLDFLLGVLRQHSNLVTSNLSFRRSLLDTLSHVSRVQKLLGDEAAPMEAKQTSLLRAVYLPSGDFKYDDQAIAAFLEARTKELVGLGLVPGADLGAQLVHLKESSKKEGKFDEKGFKKKVTRLFRLLPFLFDSDGKARFKNLEEVGERERVATLIQAHSPQQLSNAYGDLLKEHLAKTIEGASELKLSDGKPARLGQVKEWFENTKKDFVGKEVRKVLTPVGAGGAAVTTRILTAERLPNSVALFRGCYGGDCSILSVPYYPLVKDTRSYFLRKSDDPNAEPSGYVFSTLVEVNGKKVPYILTVNGASLTKSDVEMAVRMVAKDWGSDQVVLADLEKNPHLVNTTDTREGMKWGGKKTSVKFSKGWHLAEKYMNENPAKDLNGSTYTNYYRSSEVSEGYLVDVSRSDKRLAEPIQHAGGDVSRYGFGKTAGEEPVLERAILASQALSDAGISKTDEAVVRAHLNVNEAQVSAAKPLVEMSEQRALTPIEFHTAERELGFDIKGVLAREVGPRAATLKSLYEKEPELLIQHLRLGSERLAEGLAHAYRTNDKELVHKLLGFAWERPQDVLDVLKVLPAAYTADPKAVAIVAGAVPASHRSEMLANLAEGIGKRSVTDTALGIRMLTGLETSHRIARPAFVEMVQKHGSRLPSLSLTPALVDIAGRIQSHGNYAQAEREWMRDPSVSADTKAQLIRARKRMGETEANLMAHVPASQRAQVAVHLREATNLDVFEKLAGSEIAKAKRESFEFEAFHFPKSGRAFRLGSPTGEAGRFDNESERDVLLTRPFEMQATPVTQRQWELVMGSERQPRFKGNLDNPMENVSWDEAVAYAKRLSELDPRYTYRLPTEAEWEVAARAGTVTRFSFGDEEAELNQHAWTSANSGSKTHPVAELKPNANGLYDMHGGVWEWNGDWYGSHPPEGMDPQGPISGSGRVVRGGGWCFGARYARSASRGVFHPGNRYGYLGLRLVRTPK